MADFPPNLDDGELWIPSDILVSDIPAPSKTASPPPPPPPPPLHLRSTPDLSVDVHLARHFNSLYSSQLQRFGPANQFALTASPPPPYGPPPTPPTALFGLGSGSPFFSPGPVLYYQVQVQVLQPAQGVAAHVHPPQTRFPFQNGISRPESGGTGVFLPRATEDGGRRKQAWRNRSRAVSSNQNQRIGQPRRVEMSKSEEWRCHEHGSIPAAATALPGDWTY